LITPIYSEYWELSGFRAPLISGRNFPGVLGPNLWEEFNPFVGDLVSLGEYGALLRAEITGGHFVSPPGGFFGRTKFFLLAGRE